MFIAVAGLVFVTSLPTNDQTVSSSGQNSSALVTSALDTLAIKGRAEKTGYSREQFGQDWQKIGGCDLRNLVLKRDLTNLEFADDGCLVKSGLLNDNYSGKTITFIRGPNTSQEVQIDHVVALSDAWQSGAQVLSFERRVEFANDPLNLLAVDGPLNQQKGDSNAASWLPPNKQYRCAYVARQVAVKSKYELWVTQPEYNAIKSILQSCPQQTLPL